MYQLTFCTEAWCNFYSIKMFAKAPKLIFHKFESNDFYMLVILFSCMMS